MKYDYLIVGAGLLAPPSRTKQKRKGKNALSLINARMLLVIFILKK